MDGVETIPARKGKAILLGAGDRVEIVNTYGSQVLDTWAFNRHDLTEVMSMEHTRSVNSRVRPLVGDRFVSGRRRPMLTILGDTSPGRHDTLLCACNRAIYEELGCADSHRNCEDNLHEALGEVGLSVPATPGPLNLFMNVYVEPSEAIRREPPASRPGDRIELRAEMDLVLVLSACPQDITLINGESRTPRDAHYRVFRTGT